MESLGCCINYTSERRTGDYPGSEGCAMDHCTDDNGGFDPEALCFCALPEGDEEPHDCGAGCPCYEPVLDEATARNL